MDNRSRVDCRPSQLLVESRDGTTTIEYALVVSGIALVIAGLVAAFGSDVLVSLFGDIHDNIAARNGN